MNIIYEIKNNPIKYLIISIFILFVWNIYLTCKQNTIEKFTATSAPSTTAPSGISQENLRAIDNLAEIAKQLNSDGTVTLPGNLVVKGNIKSNSINSDNIKSSGNIEADGFGQFGVAKIGNHKDATNMTEFSHKDRWGHNYTLLSDRSGHTYINSMKNKIVYIRSNNNDAEGNLQINNKKVLTKNQEFTLKLGPTNDHKRHGQYLGFCGSSGGCGYINASIQPDSRFESARFMIVDTV